MSIELTDARASVPMYYFKIHMLAIILLSPNKMIFLFDLIYNFESLAQDIIVSDFFRN